MTIFVLFAIMFLKGEPHTGYSVYPTLAACKAEEAKLIETAITAHVERGGSSCIEMKLGTFS